MNADILMSFALVSMIVLASILGAAIIKMAKGYTISMYRPD